mgnify:CR=1 FL=1|tara:strand:- start:2050 stop:2379 length:330 start_codon:yes stop_codon:yes gene_type:complete
MNKNNTESQFQILRKIADNSKLTQRDLSKELGYSLGKLNYVIKELQKKGLIKMRNFKNNSNKEKYMYILTPKGLIEKTKITVQFMKRKMEEYDELKKELNNSKKKLAKN